MYVSVKYTLCSVAFFLAHVFSVILKNHIFIGLEVRNYPHGGKLKSKVF